MMTRLVSLLLVTLLSFQSLYQLGFITYFKANQEKITDLFCINKDKPELKCDGKCYLMQELNENENQSNNNSEFKNIEIPLFLLPLNGILINVEAKKIIHLDLVVLFDEILIPLLNPPPKS